MTQGAGTLREGLKSVSAEMGRENEVEQKPLSMFEFGRNVDGTAMSGFCATNGDAESIQACEWTLNESQPPSDANPKKGPAKFRIVF
eukprot:CAMPEP_0183833634 /NCGR_PEP_ID=MMETSP0807_2-20130328/6186_1 /TAXON_ID=88271 /ORGANISM="Picocystis salinarum, Strain CCMP1897" /LENGTH=86 /DNA_ID=CAMNT_0026079615 /DNA_START=8 /DNA_END=268 /DNA_ORIENTATION=+